MKIETLNELFTANHPEGWVRQGKQSNTIEVLFSAKGKIYTYRSTVYKLAERFDLIPEINIVEEAKRIAAELETSESVIGPSGGGDMLRHTYNSNVVETYGVGRDKFDRELSSYQVVDNDPWV